MDQHNYASAGVDVRRAESFVERLKKSARRPGHGQLWQAAGGYAAVYPITGEKAIAVTTDGVGTKLLVACQLGKHDTIGIDLVAMCANDLICVGATPTAFLDYYAIGKLDDARADSIMEGIIEGCDRAGMILAGGETAEMPDLYDKEHYDLAGFAIGNVSKDELLTGELIKPGQKVVAVASSGIHSNGLSLARKVLAGNKQAFEQLLTPTLIYVKPVVELLASQDVSITGIAHITGGGWRNILRLNSQVGYHFEKQLPIPSIFEEIGRTVSPQEMYATFNMGMGLCVIVESSSTKVVECFEAAGFSAQEIGVVTDKAKQLTINGLGVSFKD
jgi:phosphoribosylformylglycinamidine cyclo-ligase